MIGIGETLSDIRISWYRLGIDESAVVDLSRQLFSPVVCAYSTDKNRWHKVRFGNYKV